MERHFHFESSGSRLLGVLHSPVGAAARPLGLVLLHGWAGYRIGAHAMFVKLAREAARQGFPCLRFDFRGRGDSEGEAGAANLSTMIADACAAARELGAAAGVSQLAFIGDCSGSEVAIGAGTLVPSCRALVLWSAPIVGADREASDRAKHRHVIAQYAAKLLRRETWTKLFSGRLQTAMIRRALLRGGKGAGEDGAAADAAIDWLACFNRFTGDVLFIYGDKDPTAAEAVRHYEGLTGQLARPWHCHLVAGANHAFYSAQWEREVIGTTLEWLAARRGAGGEGDD